MPNSPDTLIPSVYYAIGDVHGEAERLLSLHEIIMDHHLLVHSGKPMVVVHLGDYVDRGPDSCAAVEIVRALEGLAERTPEMSVVSLLGNHEQQMLLAFANPDGDDLDYWKRPMIGGEATLASYDGRGEEGASLLQAHCEWMEQLPRIWRPDGTPYIFVHAGVHPREFPNESEEVYLWTRSPRFFNTNKWSSPDLENSIVIHGHTPTDTNAPDITEDGRRINVDTGAVFGGPLTAAVIAPDDKVRFLYA